jgi:DNA-binding MarR family transcriptional regulator
MSETAELDRKVLFAVERLGRALRGARQDVATRHQLSVLGVTLLESLSEQSPRRIGDIAAELDVSQPTVSDAVTTLERRALVRRVHDPDNRRSTHVSLTNLGVTLAADIAAQLHPLMQATAGSPTDRSTTLRVLLGEIARLLDAGVITVNRSCLSCAHYQPPAARTRARCHLLDRSLPDSDLRVDCPEHVAVMSAGA